MTAAISIIEDEEEDTKVDRLSSIEAALLGAVPEDTINDQVTAQTALQSCELCGRPPTLLSDFQRGINHALQRLYFQLRKHVDESLAKQIVFRLQSDDIEL